MKQRGKNSPATVAGTAVGTASQRNNAVVLSERRHGSDGAQSGQDTDATISKHTSLDTGLVGLAVNFQARDIASSGNVANGLARADDENGQQRQDERAVEAELESLDPNEGNCGGRVDTGTVKIASRRGDDATDKETKDDAGGLHDGRSESLAQDDGDKNREPETQVLGGSPGKRVRRGDVGACSEERSWVLVGTETVTTGPVLEPGLDQVDTDEHNGGSSDDWGEDAEHDLGRHERNENFDQSAEGGSSEDGTVGVRAG